MKGIISTAVLLLCLSSPTWAQDVEVSTKDVAVEKQPAFGALGLKGQIECRRNLGVTGGIVYTGGSWDFVGQGPLAFTGSGMFSMMCDAGGNNLALSFGVETAPFYVHRTYSIKVVEQWITGSVGVVMGNATFRYGALASVGVGYAGAGIRALWMPWQTRKGVGRGFELRTIAWVSDKVGVQASLQFHLTAHKRPFRVGKKK